jgi:hypothetical protein
LKTISSSGGDDEAKHLSNVFDLFFKIIGLMLLCCWLRKPKGTNLPSLRRQLSMVPMVDFINAPLTCLCNSIFVFLVIIQ